ncbi:MULTISPECIES: phenazine biosynthesis FMN-dependent oxidase PhzG [unclassified Streptomyces]|uniref:phenazine biosynthesis FMN-dependent oxidase PhzG n=1 Tax=unclassified Streptomyces TaxID=2593676 RepID=UPI002DD89B3D|nr:MULTISPECIES: phenazine biosynthesis FMN-dependent oxidase PhzG [unclassified Streptomyces]WSA93413.1 phenazine biosynthesis FMN-dependent oxidase PhzG [Streptomyces sp. NBC_01795]WSB77782.1 phenazine biosynthesis FMN-dependent oxidase PhzG [Streptomyces sp. NBC_01775]WSS42790.1 phenazine biosynthesis FMN-dependent oxidase PhzG [Streptomyces sp. NBC_01187]
MDTDRSETLTAASDVTFPEYVAPPAEPLGLLRRWLESAEAHGVREPRALALATADARGRASLRTVVLNRVTGTGLVIATHDGSRKGRELRVNPWASGLLYWRETGQQISLGGPVRRLSDTESDALWAARPVFTHAMTVSSRQSEPLGDLADVARLRARAETVSGQGPQPRPAAYVGLELVPESIEFWANGTSRLHERLRYDRTPEGWTTARLQP